MSTTTTEAPATQERNLQRMTGLWSWKSKAGQNYFAGAIQAPRPQDVMPEHIRQALTTLADQRVIVFYKRDGAQGSYSMELFLDKQPPRPKQANTQGS
jgi:hypothetical protein